MTTETHIAGLERRITDMLEKAADYDRAAMMLTAPLSRADLAAQKLLQHSASSCRLDAEKCRAKIAALQELEAATTVQQPLLGLENAA